MQCASPTAYYYCCVLWKALESWKLRQVHCGRRVRPANRTVLAPRCRSMGAGAIHSVLQRDYYHRFFFLHLVPTNRPDSLFCTTSGPIPPSFDTGAIFTLVLALCAHLILPEFHPFDRVWSLQSCGLAFGQPQHRSLQPTPPPQPSVSYTAAKMLSEGFISSICGPPLAANTAISKDIGIYSQSLTPSYAVKASFKKSSCPKHGLAVSDTHIFAAQDQKAQVHVYSRSRGNQEALVSFAERIRSLALAGNVLVVGSTEGRLILWEVRFFCISSYAATLWRVDADK